ncbi:hypothetical protein O9X80_23335 [Agrobacterium salinitolerans]|uniref:hypothetical protein n=1 Tax=Agrobacterium salinitolerans TaxID=1183413 RepID=UPI0022B81499|nr:hypothetical protein [Agrobacterium salinitolerans]MCZ7977438.1 hypothetical protein [Agrobacterium salinitolerans]
MTEIKHFDKHSPSYPDTPMSGADEAQEIAQILKSKLSEGEIIRVRHLILKGADTAMLAGILIADQKE